MRFLSRSARQGKSRLRSRERGTGWRAGADNLDLIGAREPVSEAEYALSCEGMWIYLRTVLEADNAIEALRDFAAGAG